VKRQILNQLINVFWTVLAFAPVIAFWMAAGDFLILYILIALSLCILFLPDGFYQNVQLSKEAGYYEKMGLRFFRRFTQDGDLITKILTKGQVEFKSRRTRASLMSYLKQIEGYERYHMTCLVFFTLTTLYAIGLANFGIALLTTLSNIVYNVIPLLLQQYNRLRITKLKRM